ncbi:UbiA family prenyltransferase [Chitinophaga solisilvae]|uniref:UbiA family prenyltransferase n=1 Tax=Chitinophaga solisilvae TaxID=1233460 RepID=A0A433WJI2_9BACT|nr:UbiA family prenyltransferase [Chitinophaga solisilvae]NSL87899.1 UbiA family prenyltransferase [Chitinophaga solisilvae]
MLKSIFNFFLYTSVYISVCALLMIWQTNQILALHYPQQTFYLFVFFSTICSYNFHWYLTPGAFSQSDRLQWCERHRNLMLVLCGTGLAGALYYFWQLREHWLVLSGGAILTFLYSAPKVPHKTFTWLRKIAVGKTLFLTSVWTYVTTLLPALMANQVFSWPLLFLGLHRFFLIYAICILFDYRDVESDRKEGIRSLITWLDLSSLNKIYYFSLLIAAVTAGLLGPYSTLPVIFTLMAPVVFTAGLTDMAQRRPSDYLYYFGLDGLMAFSALLHMAVSVLFKS